VALGWNEGSVGVALGMMGFTALLVQTFAGDVVDKTQLDRRAFLSVSAIATAFSASAILFVHEGNSDRALMYGTKVIEGVSSSFIGPCVAALTLATFGPDAFDEVMASNILWGHVGSIASAVLAGVVGYVMYPDIKYCFLVIGFSAIMAVVGVQFLPEGDPLMGRGLQTRHNAADSNAIGRSDDDDAALEPPFTGNNMRNEDSSAEYVNMKQHYVDHEEQTVSSYWSVFSDRKTVVLCLTGFFFQ
jgi:MFS family permease